MKFFHLAIIFLYSLHLHSQTLVWETNLDQSGYFRAFDLERSIDGGFLIAGNYDTGSESDAALIKTDSVGNIEWTYSVDDPPGSMEQWYYFTSVAQSYDSSIICSFYNDGNQSNQGFILTPSGQLKTNGIKPMPDDDYLRFGTFNNGKLFKIGGGTGELFSFLNQNLVSTYEFTFLLPRIKDNPICIEDTILLSSRYGTVKLDSSNNSTKITQLIDLNTPKSILDAVEVSNDSILLLFRNGSLYNYSSGIWTYSISTDTVVKTHDFVFQNSSSYNELFVNKNRTQYLMMGAINGEWRIDRYNLNFQILDSLILGLAPEESVSYETDMQQVKILRDDKDETVFYVYNKRNLQKWVFEDFSGAATDISEPILKEGFTIYPNPAKDKLHILIENDEISSVQLYTLTGTLILESTIQSQTDIDVSSLQSGIYLLKITGNWGEETQKLIIE